MLNIISPNMSAINIVRDDMKTLTTHEQEVTSDENHLRTYHNGSVDMDDLRFALLWITRKLSLRYVY